MMAAERGRGGPDPDMTISYAASSGTESGERWKLDREKRCPPPAPQYLFLQDNYKVRQ